MKLLQGKCALVVWVLGIALGCHAPTPPPPVQDAGLPAPAPPAVADAAPRAAPYERRVVQLPPLGRQVNVLLVLLSHKDVHLPWVPKRSRNRTPAEAEKLARRVTDAARRGADFVALAKQYSDWPFAAQNGGQLGIQTEGAGDLPEIVEQGLRLSVGVVSDPIPTPFGYAVLKRLPVMRISHIAIGYEGLPGSRQTRTRAEAEQLVAQIRGDLLSGTHTFADQAFQYSDDLGSAGRGGDLGSFDEKTALMPQIRKVAAELKPGQLSAPFVSPLGLELVWRAE
jgi:hypothetical protein